MMGGPGVCIRHLGYPLINLEISQFNSMQIVYSESETLLFHIRKDTATNSIVNNIGSINPRGPEVPKPSRLFSTLTMFDEQKVGGS